MCAYVGVSQQSADCLTKKKHKSNFHCITLKIHGAVTTMMFVSVWLNLCEHDSNRQHDAMRWSFFLSFIECASVFWLLLSKSVRHICHLKPDTQAALLTAMDFSFRLTCIQETCGQYVKKYLTHGHEKMQGPKGLEVSSAASFETNLSKKQTKQVALGYRVSILSYTLSLSGLLLAQISEFECKS